MTTEEDASTKTDIDYALKSTKIMQTLLKGGMYVKHWTGEYISELAFPNWQVGPDSLLFLQEAPEPGNKQTVYRELLALTVIDYRRQDGKPATKFREIWRSRVVSQATTVGGQATLLSEPADVHYKQKEWSAEYKAANGQKWILLDVDVKDLTDPTDQDRSQNIHQTKLVQEKWSLLKEMELSDNVKQQFTYTTEPPFLARHTAPKPDSWEGYEIRFMRRPWESPQPLPMPLSLNPGMGLPANDTWYVCTPGNLPHRAQKEASPSPSAQTPQTNQEDRWRIASPSPWTATSEIVLRTPTAKGIANPSPAKEDTLRVPAPIPELPDTQDYSGKAATDEEGLFGGY